MKKEKKLQKVGVILMTYGSPSNLDGVHDYLKNIYGGKKPARETVLEFKRRYKLIGGSPLVKITKAQALCLQNELKDCKKDKYIFEVKAGMRFSHPFISEAVLSLSSSCDLIVGIIMSPQYSPIIMRGYVRELEKAVEPFSKKLKLKMAYDWHTQPYFIKALGQKVKEGLKNLPSDTVVLFSAHSMPKRVIDKEPEYISFLKETALLVAKDCNLPKDQWMFCYQSAGHTPEEWLKPDFADIMPKLAAGGKKNVLIAPVQFLSDHLEILYDVGIAARQQALDHGIGFAKTKSLNTSSYFIKALKSVVLSTL